MSIILMGYQASLIRLRDVLKLNVKHLYLSTMPRDLHDDLLSYLGNDIKLTIEVVYTLNRAFVLKYKHHVCIFHIDIVSGILDWLIKRSYNSALQIYGAYSFEAIAPCRFLFDKYTEGELHILAQDRADDKEIKFNAIESLFFEYKLSKLCHQK